MAVLRPVVVDHRHLAPTTSEGDLERVGPVDVGSGDRLDDLVELRGNPVAEVEGDHLQRRNVTKASAEVLHEGVTKLAVELRAIDQLDVRLAAHVVDHHPVQQLGCHAPGGARDTSQQPQTVLPRLGRCRPRVRHTSHGHGSASPLVVCQKSIYTSGHCSVRLVEISKLYN